MAEVMELPGVLELLWRWEASGDFTPGLLPLLPPPGKALSRLRCLCMLKSRVPFSSTSMSADCKAKEQLCLRPTPPWAWTRRRQLGRRRDRFPQKEAKHSRRAFET